MTAERDGRSSQRPNFAQRLLNPVKNKPQLDPDMSPEYDFSDGVRGKYAGRHAESNAVLSDPYLEARAKRADGRGWKLLDEAPDAPPLPGDERP